MHRPRLELEEARAEIKVLDRYAIRLETLLAALVTAAISRHQPDGRYGRREKAAAPVGGNPKPKH